MKSPLKNSLIIVFPYFLLSVVWIYFSDKFLDSLHFNIQTISTIQTYKGIFFVSCTTIFLFFQLKRMFKAIILHQENQQRQEKIYKAMNDNGNDIVTLGSTDGTILYISDNVFRYLGYTSTELTNASYFQKIHPEDLEIVKSVRTKVLNNPGITYTFEMRLLHKNGEYVWVESNLINKLDDPLLKSFVGNTRIINYRKKYESKLKESEELFRAIFEQAPVGLVFTDLHGRIHKMNSKHMEMTGYTLEEFNNMEFMELTHKDDFIRDYKLFQELITGKFDNYTITKRIIRKDGNIIWVIKNASLIKDSTGKIIYVNNAIQDISDKVNADIELAYRNKELDTYMYRTSHDLRGPIATMMGLSAFAAEETADSTAIGYFNNINTVAKNTDKLLTNLMAVAQIRETEINQTQINAHDFFTGMIQKLRKNYQNDHTRLEIAIDPETTIYSDPDLLTIIIKNLVDNAFKFKNQGTTDHEIVLNAYCCSGKFKIVIKDNGIGVSETDQQRMFDMYYKGMHQVPGNGIGLYVVKGAVDKLKGKIEVNSILDKGTEIIICIPNICSASLKC